MERCLIHTHVNPVPSLKIKEGATTIPKGSTFQVKFLIWKCHETQYEFKIWSNPLINIGKPKV